MRVLLLLGLLCLLMPEPCAADDLLILALFARVTPAGQVEPVPDPFIESILNGKLRNPLKTFRHCREKLTRSAPGPRTLSQSSMASKASESSSALPPLF